jgi:hypothetical protein
VVAWGTNPVLLGGDWSGRRDSNPRPQPWQGCALPLSYARTAHLLFLPRTKNDDKRASNCRRSGTSGGRENLASEALEFVRPQENALRLPSLPLGASQLKRAARPNLTLSSNSSTPRELSAAPIGVPRMGVHPSHAPSPLARYQAAISSPCMQITRGSAANSAKTAASASIRCGTPEI